MGKLISILLSVLLVTPAMGQVYLQGSQTPGGLSQKNSTVQTDSGGAAVLVPFGQTTGTATNDSAGPGQVGEVISAVVGVGVAAATGVVVTTATINVTPGDWDVSGEVWYATGGATVIVAGINTAATMPGVPSMGAAITTVNNPNANSNVPLAMVRLSLASTTNVFLLAEQFGGTGATVGGKIWARRAR
jgi:hypothetical protein